MFFILAVLNLSEDSDSMGMPLVLFDRYMGGQLAETPATSLCPSACIQTFKKNYSLICYIYTVEKGLGEKIKKV